jgi:hypothetical protein
MVFDLSIREDEKSPLFSKARNAETQNGFFTIDSHGQDLSGSILGFKVGLAKTKLLQFEGLSR